MSMEKKMHHANSIDHLLRGRAPFFFFFFFFFFTFSRF